MNSLHTSYFDIQGKFAKGELSFEEYSKQIMSWNSEFSSIIKAQWDQFGQDGSRGGRLVKKKITDKTGKQVTKWVKRDGDDNEEAQLNNIIAERKRLEQKVSIDKWKSSLPAASEVALRNASKYASSEEVRSLARNELFKRSFNLENFVDMSLFPQFMLDDYIKRYDGFQEKLTEKENDAIIDYVVKLGSRLNKKLFSGDKLETEERAVVARLDRAIGKSQFINDVVLHSGLSFKAVPLFITHIKSLKPGDTYEQASFPKASLLQGNAFKFDDIYSSVNNLKVKVYASKGQNGLCVQRERSEFLLPRKSKFQVIENSDNFVGVKLLD